MDGVIIHRPLLSIIVFDPPNRRNFGLPAFNFESDQSASRFRADRVAITLSMPPSSLTRLLALTKLSIEIEALAFGGAALGGLPTGLPVPAALTEGDFIVFFFLPIVVDLMVLMNAGVTSIPTFLNSAEISFGLAVGCEA